MIKGILFDLDGTLLDSLDVWEKVDDTFLEKRGIEGTQDYHDALLNMRFIEAAHYTIERYDLKENVDDIMKEWMELAKQMYHHQIQLKNGAYDFIKSLKGKGYKLGIVTSCHKELFEPCLKRHGLWNEFEIIVEANVVNMSKIQPDIYHYVLDKMKLEPSECLFFDDVYASLKAANEVGIRIIAMNDPLSYDKNIETVTKQIIVDFTNLEDFF